MRRALSAAACKRWREARVGWRGTAAPLPQAVQRPGNGCDAATRCAPAACSPSDHARCAVAAHQQGTQHEHAAARAPAGSGGVHGRRAAQMGGTERLAWDAEPAGANRRLMAGWEPCKPRRERAAAARDSRQDCLVTPGRPAAATVGSRSWRSAQRRARRPATQAGPPSNAPPSDPGTHRRAPGPAHSAPLRGVFAEPPARGLPPVAVITPFHGAIAHGRLPSLSHHRPTAFPRGACSAPALVPGQPPAARE